jgi:hypothetical protein
MERLRKWGVATVEELDKKDFGNYFLGKDVTGQDMSPRSAAASLHSNLSLIDQYVLSMNQIRDTHHTQVLQSINHLRQKRRNERLFSIKSKSLVRRPEFKSRVSQQYILLRDLFNSVGFLDHGKMLNPWQKAILGTPDRVYEKNRRWVPNDDVRNKQKHVFFESTLKPVERRRRPLSLPKFRLEAK